MLKLGIIGTSAISHSFLDAANKTAQYKLSAVYSRTLEKAGSFSQPYGQVALYDDLIAFLDSDLDVIYIASPNSLHYPQAKLALLAKKHVILEKPAVTTPKEWKELVKLANEHQVYLFESARNYHEKAFTTIQDFLKDKTVLGGHMTYAKYSSKMLEFLKGNIPNIFSDQFAGGALMDLGVYPLYFAIGLFGQPESVTYRARQLPSSIDLNGHGSLVYSDFVIGIQAGKDVTSNLPAEIYTTDGTLFISGIEAVSQALFQDHSGNSYQLPITPASHNMLEEAQAFASMMTEGNPTLYQTWLQTGQMVHQALYAMRQDAGIHFKDEN